MNSQLRWACLAVFVIMVAAAAGWLGGAASAQDPGNRFVGAFYTHDTLSRYEMPIEVDATGKDRSPTKIEEQRGVFAVPNHYGSLIEITQNADRAILWYLGTDNVLRNVVLDKSDILLMEVRVNKVDKLRVEVVR